jgi:uncharacterized membrane protein
MRKNENSKKRKSAGGLIRRYFIAGIATILPLFITVYVIVLVIRFAYDIAGKYINAYLLDAFGFDIPGLGLLILILSILSIGFLSSHFIGRRLFPIFEKIITKIPFVAGIYPSAKQLSDFLFEEEGKKKFKKVVLVPYPTNDSYSLGFITNEETEILKGESGKELVTVLVPLAPAPFSGVLLFLPKEKIRVLNISVDNAIKLIVSGGVVMPEKKANTRRGR